MKQATAANVLLVLTLVLATVGIQAVKAPDVVPANDSPDLFSAERALNHLRAIADQPRPTGSEAHRRAREYIFQQLKGLGLTPEIQETIVTRGAPGRPVIGTRVVNVMAVHPGREKGKALLVMSHYDTTPTSPGAGDDGSGVAAILEAARALVAKGPRRNDIIFLFTDAEEVGLDGAQAFMEHPWAKRVGMVVNLEARGTRGPGLMFETSDQNGRLIEEFRRAVPRPMAASYSYEIYKILPNDTDFTVLRRAGVPGLNFAFIEGGMGYHGPQDSIDNLDPRSLQHQGDSVLGLMRHLGDRDLDSGWQTRNSIYFNLLGPWFISYSQAWALPLTVLVALAGLALFVIGLRKKRVSIGGTIGGFFGILLGAVVFVGVPMFASQMAFSWRYDFELAGSTSNLLRLLALASMAIGLTIGAWRVLEKKISSKNLIAAGLLLWTILNLAISLVAPGASYLFTWPLLLCLVAVAFWYRRGTEEDMSPLVIALFGLAVAGIALLWAPTLSLISIAVGGPAAIFNGLFIFFLLAGLLAALLTMLTPVSQRSLLIAPLVLGILGLFAVELGSGYSPDNPRPNSLMYALDAEEGEAQWVSLDRAPDEWSSQFLLHHPDKGMLPEYIGRPRPALVAAAPTAPLDEAKVLLVGESRSDESYQLDVLISWDWPVERAAFFLRSESDIRSLTLAGKTIERPEDFGPGDAPSRTIMFFFAPPEDGIRLGVELAGEETLEIETIGQHYGLPELSDFIYKPRPAHLMPEANWSDHSTFVRGISTVVPGTAQPAPESAEPVSLPEGYETTRATNANLALEGD